ncbi:MAG: CBS domain-containing protein, partial [Phycisphaerales bacterium]|nr:CBS domain-containing protein [Phycisphaerales bacterium]
TLDNTTGFVLRDRVMELALAGRHEIKLRQIARPIHIVPETKTLASLLEEFLRRHEHLFLVVNEYGGAEGVVTLEDVVEALLGAPIVDETDATLDLRAAAMRRVREHRERIRALEAESHGIPDPD